MKILRLFVVFVIYQLSTSILLSGCAYSDISYSPLSGVWTFNSGAYAGGFTVTSTSDLKRFRVIHSTLMYQGVEYSLNDSVIHFEDINTPIFFALQVNDLGMHFYASPSRDFKTLNATGCVISKTGLNQPTSPNAFTCYKN